MYVPLWCKSNFSFLEGASHPEELVEACAALGIETGAVVAITSRRATVHAVVKESEDLRRGLVSMSHAYGLDLSKLEPGANPGDPQPFSLGNHTGALSSAELDYEEPYTGLPRMSSIPVHVEVVRRPA